ncbi:MULTISPECIES: TIR domain-containing protein [unclassified Sphingopyxis]|uniref:TIR domain-containing protein n=1 Tax=unclassified Sphingopyxis TaxID=2614943 RepID=UPI0009E996E4|nr:MULTISPECIES: TIR domain-containing protein [unclassified Sphingopyxis]
MALRNALQNGEKVRMTSTPNQAPRAFTSYSWSSPTHEAWVLDLASRLREDGVDVILDKWDLKPGHDSYQFMESMVTDKSVTKVMMICDKAYVEKANRRAGGVGTESQIISPELYGQGAQDKYAALMTDEDEEGNAHVPVFYKGRIFFDFRSAEKFEESYEQLLRWLVDRPQHVKPKLGSVPETILQANPVASGTQSRARRAEDAIRNGANTAAPYIRDYGDALYAELKALAPALGDAEPYDETILASVAAMRPYLRQFADVAGAAVRFANEPRLWDRILAIHEQLGTLMFRDPELSSWNRVQFDAHKIVAHDAFLTSIALALDEERFDLVEAALTRPYLVEEREVTSRRATADFTVFRPYVQSLELRNERLKLRRISLDADVLHDAFPRGSHPSFESLMQADFILYLRAAKQKTVGNWYPYSLLYASDRFAPFPVFARSESRSYFERLAPLLATDSIATFKEHLAEVARNSARLFDHNGLPVSYLGNAEQLGTVA